MRMIPRFRASRRVLAEITLSLKYFLEEPIVKALLWRLPQRTARCGISRVNSLKSWTPLTGFGAPAHKP
jgi:hypothetical protein